MIKRFKKGTYKLSAIAMIFFIALGCFTLTNAKADINTVSEPFSLGDEFTKTFYDLDRAMDFIDFDFKLPDNIPSNYKFTTIYFDDKEDLVSIGFDKTDDEGHSSVYIKTSKKDLIEPLKKEHLDTNEEINERTIKPEVKFVEEPMNISNIKGTCLTVNKKWEWKEEDLADVKKFNTKKENKGTRAVLQRMLPKEEIDKYFIWQDDDIWYYIRYYRKHTHITHINSSTITHRIPKDDINILTSSLKYPKDIQNVEYISEDANKSLIIYDNKDLDTAKEILGFAPKFPLNLPGGFVPVYSCIDSHGKTIKNEIIRMKTNFQLKDKDSVQELHLYQAKSSTKFDDMVQNGYVTGNPYSKDPKDKKIKITPIMIDDIKVLKYELDIINPNIISEGITKNQHYIWKQDDIVYEVDFVGDMGNQEKIVKALINTP